MIRSAEVGDVRAMIDVVDATKLFKPDGLDEVEAILNGYFAGTLDEDHHWIVDIDDGVPIAVAYFAPERMTEGTWNLYLIAVLPNRQGEGRGAALIRYVEATLIARAERVLLVETSGLTSFEATRGFYRRCGFDEEARIREFYAAGDDKIIFRKALGEAGAVSQ